MSILLPPLLPRGAKIIAVSATGPYGRAQIAFMKRHGSHVVAVVAPGRTGMSEDGIPYFDTVAEAMEATAADAAANYTPAGGCASAIVECADAGVPVMLAAAERVPVHDSLYALPYARERGSWVAGPNSVGIMRVGRALLGSFPGEFTLPGRTAILGRSGTLTMTVARILSMHGFGQSWLCHIGGDLLAGRNPHEWLEYLLSDEGTDQVIYCGELGGSKEYAMLDIVSAAKKPILCMIAGRHAPTGKRMGHAGALANAQRETAAAKASALEEAGARVAKTPYGLIDHLKTMNVSRQETKQALQA
jgi:succinyl-CoA synthetase alpha subunit